MQCLMLHVLRIKTHSGLISNFSLQLVKPGLIDIELGKALNKVEDLRLIADYKGDEITLENAAWAIEQAATFLASVRITFFNNEN